MDDAAIPWANRVKYLGCYFLGHSGDVDFSVFIGKFYGSFNNILNILGHNRNGILAVDLVKTYCLPTAVYGGEVWSPRSSALTSLSVAWNNAFRRILNTCWRRVPASLQLYCDCLLIAYLLDQRRLLFWKKMSISNNTLLRFPSKACLIA